MRRAYDYFFSVEAPNALELHKLAICCEQLGYRNEALAALEKAAVSDVDGCSVSQKLFDQMCGLVRFRLTNVHYIENPAYGALLTGVFAECRKTLPVGFAAFHLPWMLEFYTMSRQYRAAYELLKEFPGRA